METSILKTVKSSLGLAVTDTSFDGELILYINTVLATLNQIGVGPEAGFQIVDAVATWDNLLGSDLRLNNVQTYICAKVRLLFDPPQSAFGIEAMERVTKELEIRIYLAHEADIWIPEPTNPNDLILDGGKP